jgi:hypothetical protein
VPTLSFDGETHDEIVAKVRRWLTSVEGRTSPPTAVTATAVESASELAKQALEVVADTYGHGSHGEMVKTLTRLGTELTEGTKELMVSGLNFLTEVSEANDWGARKQTQGMGRRMVSDFNTAMAKQFLKTLKG